MEEEPISKKGLALVVALCAALLGFLFYDLREEKKQRLEEEAERLRKEEAARLRRRRYEAELAAAPTRTMYLVRHAEPGFGTVDNGALTKHGVAQARTTAAQLQEYLSDSDKTVLVVTSPADRCIATGSIIVSELNGTIQTWDCLGLGDWITFCKGMDRLYEELLRDEHHLVVVTHEHHVKSLAEQRGTIDHAELVVVDFKLVRGELVVS